MVVVAEGKSEVLRRERRIGEGEFKRFNAEVTESTEFTEKRKREGGVKPPLQ